MFDIGFWELTVLAVIGLIVLGPERLPIVARTLGLWVGRAKGYVRGITSELEREAQVDDIRSEVRRTREQIESDTQSAVRPASEALATERPTAMPEKTESDSADTDEGGASSSAAPAGDGKPGDERA